jgi:RHS repeat-associated protein
MTRAATTLRTFVHDAGGNITSDTRSGTAYAYTYGYNKRNRLNTVTVAASLKGTYTYNAREQLSIRVTTNMTPAGTTHFIHDLNGNVIAETAGGGATGTTGTVREYIYLPETEIAPAVDGRTRVDRPLAVVNAVNTATPATYYVHVDHLNRPVMMTDGAKAQVWAATWQAWGGSYAITGPQANDSRFPGQWFQLESGLHYNWHRHYDPSIGRFTQPDPLGFVDGPSVYGYVKGLPQQGIDPDGRNSGAGSVGGTIGQAIGTFTPIPGGAAAGRIIGTGIGIGVSYICTRNVTCIASCNVQQIDPAAQCPDRVTGGPASSKSEYLACRAAKKDADKNVPRGCYKRHCQCDCQ